MISTIDSIRVPHDTTHHQDCHMSFLQDILAVLGILCSYTPYRRVLSARPNTHVFFNAAHYNNMEHERESFYSAFLTMY